MLNLVSDPTTYPIRDVPLTRPDGALAVEDIQPASGVVDQAFERPDKGYNVMEFARRADLTLKVSHLNVEAARQLDELSGLSAFGRARTPVRFFPNLDRHTWLCAPMTGHHNIFRRSLTTDVLEKATLSHTRTTAVPTIDEYGRISFVAPDTPAFAPSAIGRGMYATDQYSENWLDDTHPTSGDLVYSVYTTGALSWSTLPSPVVGMGGCLRFDTDGSPTATISVTQTIPTDSVRLWTWEVWMRGRGSVQLQAKAGAAIIQSSSTYELTDEWKPYRVTFTNALAGSSVILFVAFQGTDPGVAFIGPSAMRLSPGAVEHGPIVWTGQDAVETIQDTSGALIPPDSYTAVVVGIIPEEDVTRGDLLDSDALRIGAYPAGSGSYFFAQCKPAGYTPFVKHRDVGSPGDPFVLVVRQRPDEVFDITLRGPDGAASDQTTVTNDVVGGTVQFGRSTLHPGLIAPQFYRIDARAWTDQEAADYSRLFMHPGVRDVIRRTFGKLFRIAAVNLRPTAPAGRAVSGTISLVQVGTDPDFAIT